LTSKYEFDGEKVVKVLSNPRRYSYSLGYGTKTKTAYDFLIGKGKVNSLDELINRFSVEVVNKQFYNEIALAFTKLVGGQRDGKSFEKELSLYGVTDQNKYAEFAVRLIGRIVFCWFLKEKKSENGIPLIPESMLALDSVKTSRNYYHDTLEPLFFELLNTNQPRRKGKFAREEIYTQIPYLNGGLFSPHADDHYKFAPELQTGQYGLVTIPNGWFEHFYEILGQYNFTVDENTSYDIELSIDPEMLGRIFENLLAEINPETGENAKKSTGSFYTPRDIVDYMVDSSILEHLKAKTGIDEAKLRALISYGKEDDELATFSMPEKKALINALYTITVLDPACGSGAFPIGMLQKIVYMLQEIDPEANLWFDKATENVSFLIKKEFEKKFNAGSLDYIRKLTVIQNSIFGVDIQPIAVEIARLRCFLSLVIEEKVYDDEPNRGINPLPNLDFKFIIANTLVTLPHDSDHNKDIQADQMSMFEREDHISQLKAVREEYFSANDAESKNELKLAFSEIQKAMFQEALDNRKAASARYQALFQWKPFKNEVTNWFDPEWMFGIKDEFDIVIGNPPYIKERDAKEIFAPIINTVWGKKWHQGKMDYWYFFAHKAFDILKRDGHLCFIASNYYPSSTGGVKLNEYLARNTTIKNYIDFNKIMVFDTADVQTMILLVENQPTEKSGIAIRFNTNDRTSIGAGLHNYQNSNCVDVFEIEQTANLLNSDKQLVFVKSESSVILDKMDSLRATDLIKSTQGVVENPNVVNTSNYKILKASGENIDNIHIGDEVFVISCARLDELGLNAEELEFIKPYHYPSEIRKYVCDDAYEYYLIYLTRDNIDNIDKYPNIKKHLLPYKPIMDQRRETTNGSNKWFHLHWPRKESVFSVEKIIYPQMCDVPTFAYSDNTYFVNMSANIIYRINSQVDLRVLTAILNSTLYRFWLQNKAKKRGINIDISVAVIDKLPINLSILSDKTLKDLTNALYEKLSDRVEITSVEKSINTRLYELYGLTKEEIAVVEAIIH